MTRYATAFIGYKQPVTPDQFADLVPSPGDIWVDESSFPPIVKKCTGSNPFTWVSIEGGGPATLTPVNISHTVSANGNNATNIKNSTGQVFGWKIYNNAGYPVYVKLYNKATAPIPGTDTPAQTIGVDAGLSAELSIDAGIQYGVGIGFAIVKGIADADNTSVVAGDCVVDILWL